MQDKTPPTPHAIFSRLSVTAYVCIGVVIIFILAILAMLFMHFASHSVSRYIQDHNTKTSTVAITAPVVSTSSLPVAKELEDGYFISQTFNNCGPSALSMDLSFYGVHASQETLADDLRPTHNDTGKGDDKSTTPEEIVAEAAKYGFTAYYRPHGSIQLLKEFIANGIPVMTRTLFIPTEDYGHYRVMKGYDDTTGTIIDEDGFQGPEVKYSYADFMSLWQEYNYEYIVLVPPGKEALVESIIGSDMNEKTAWQNAAAVAESQLAGQLSSDGTSITVSTSTGDTVMSSTMTRAIFNLSVADYYLADYAASVRDFEEVESLIPEHTLWYQMEPIEAYFEVGNYPKVFSLAQSILTNGDAVYPELYVLEGEAYEKEGNTAAANAAFATALKYNPNLPTIDAAAKAVFTQYDVSY